MPTAGFYCREETAGFTMTGVSLPEQLEGTPGEETEDEMQMWGEAGTFDGQNAWKVSRVRQKRKC